MSVTEINRSGGVAAGPFSLVVSVHIHSTFPRTIKGLCIHVINLGKHHFLLDRWWLEPTSSNWAKRYISFGSSYRLLKAFDDTPLTCITSAFWNTANTSLPLLSSDVTSYSQFIDRFISRKRTFEVFWVRNLLLFSWSFSRRIFMQTSLFVLRNKLKRAFCRANLTFKSQILVALFMRIRAIDGALKAKRCRY